MAFERFRGHQARVHDDERGQFFRLISRAKTPALGPGRKRRSFT
jgi:hypothetical protein